jgi:hypothetical protein
MMTRSRLPENLRWIGAHRSVNGAFPIETTYFKTIFTLPNVPRHMPLYISANNRYCLYVNGTEAGRGPCRGDHWHQYGDTVDIAAFLCPGENVIAVKVVAYQPLEVNDAKAGNIGPTWCMSGAMGPMLIAFCDGADIPTMADISTGRAEWFCINDTANRWPHQSFVHFLGNCEDADGAKIPHGWQTAPLTPDWLPAVPKWISQTNPYGETHKLPLYDRPIKPMMRKTLPPLTFFPPDIPLASNGVYESLLDIGQMTTAYVYLHTTGGAGSKITLHYAEAFGKNGIKGHRGDETGELMCYTDIYRPGGGTEEYSPLAFRTFKFIKITVKTASEALTLQPLRVIETRYPLQDNVTFETDESWVQPVWDISRRTLELCMHETYEDCPFYEQLQYTKDTRLQMLFTYVLGNDTDMQRKGIHDFHTSALPEGILQCRFPNKYHQVIPGFSLHWVFMLRDWYTETGDVKLLDFYRPTMEGVLGWFRRHKGSHGLAEYMPYWNFADWTAAWSDTAGVPRAALHGPSAIANLTYACALEDAAYILEAMELNELALRYKNEKTAILEAVNRLCWSEKKQLYREGPDFEEYSQHAQVWAVLAGAASAERARGVMNKVLRDTSLIPCSFVMQYYLFRALEKAGMYGETEGLWELWKGLPDLGLTTVPEVPGPRTRSDCHAWGALLLHELPRKFLGIAPAEPGYKTITIQPKALYMKKMKGEAPTPHGQVQVAWAVSGSRFTIEGTTPVQANIILPNGTQHTAAPGSFAYECGVLQ